MQSFFWLAVRFLPLLQDDFGDNGAAAAAASTTGSLFGAVVGILIAGALLWGIFTKAGKPGWTGFIPLWNTIQLLDVVGRPMWWFVLLLIPCVNIVVLVIVMIDLAKSFGKGTGYGIGLIIPFVNLVLMAMLSYGDAKYLGPAAKNLPAPTM